VWRSGDDRDKEDTIGLSWRKFMGVFLGEVTSIGLVRNSGRFNAVLIVILRQISRPVSVEQILSL
jgi:hypothetical protein